MPAVSAGHRIQRHYRVRKQIISAACGTVVIRPGISGVYIEKPQVGIERGLHPHGSAAGLPGFALPGFVARLARTRYRIPAPDLVARFCLVRGETSTQAAIPA